jgi:hypothetical protein
LTVLLPQLGDLRSEQLIQRTEEVLRHTFGAAELSRFDGPFHTFWADLYRDRSYRIVSRKTSLGTASGGSAGSRGPGATAAHGDAEDPTGAIAAIRGGLADVDAGRTQPAEEVFAELRERYGIPPDA